MGFLTLRISSGAWLLTASNAYEDVQTLNSSSNVALEPFGLRGRHPFPRQSPDIFP